MSKVTMGNSCFLLTNVGVRPIMSNSGLISTEAFKSAGGSTFSSLEGSVWVCCAGQALNWLNVGLGMAREEVVDLQEDEDEDGCGGVVIVPAYGGLLCPRSRPDAAGVIPMYTSPVLNFLQQETEALTGSNKFTSLLIW
jgi:glycerol kinase